VPEVLLVAAAFQARRWIHDFAPLAGLPPDAFAERLVSDLTGSGAARWEHDCLVSTVPHSRNTHRWRSG
jgi:hypothetical protein